MKAIIVGLGSMGKRRARLLHTLDKSIQIIGVDVQKERRRQAEAELGIVTGHSIEAVCKANDLDIAFVSTSPLSHSAIIKECLEKNLHVFTELNLVTAGYDENIELARKKSRVLFLSSTFLYRKEIQFIENCIRECRGKFSYMYHAGQYLPDWHPWESYKNFFVGDKRTNGCREFMAIEFPWIIDVFGEIKDIYVKKGNNSRLEVDFPDSYQIMLEHEKGYKGMIAIDVVSRKAIRRLEISGEDIYLTWDGTPDSLKIYDYNNKCEKNILLYDSVENREEYSAFIIEDAYKSEIENFLNIIEGKEEARYSFEKDKIILSIIDRIEERKTNNDTE